MDIFACAMVLFLVMDPLGNMPLFLTALGPVAEERRHRVIAREMLIAYGFLLFFLFGGDLLLDWLRLSQESVSIAGAIILFLVALKMIFSGTGSPFGKSEGEGNGREPLVVPLATPAIAGPSALAVLMMMSHNYPSHLLGLTLATTLAWVATAAILLASTLLYRLLGDRGLEAAQRLMAMLLVMLSVQMMLDALDARFGISAVVP